MIKERIHVFRIGHAAVDVALTTAAFFIAAGMRRAFLPASLKPFLDPGRIGWMLLVIVPVWFILLNYERAYLSFEDRSSRSISIRAAKAVLEGLGILLAVIFFRRAFAHSRLFILLFGALDVALLVSARMLIFQLRKHFYARGSNLHQVLVVGADEKALTVKRLIADQSQWGFKVMGFLALGPDRPPAEACKPLLGDLKDLGKILHNSHVDWVVFAVDPDEIDLVRSGIKECEDVGVPASYLMGDMFPLRIASMHLDTYDGAAFLTFTTVTSYRWSLMVKGVLDRVAALLAAVLLSPLMLLIGIMIKLTSKGPVFFNQERSGLNGRRFVLHKFRTMSVDAEEMLDDIREMSGTESDITFKLRGDPRVTRVGRYLRRLSLDELPQLYNVLKGEMSMVGPRPPIPAEVEKYERWQRRRLSMKPGLTCIWQVSGRNEVDFEEWMELDLKYIDNWSLTLDTALLLKTIPAVLTGKGAY